MTNCFPKTCYSEDQGGDVIYQETPYLPYELAPAEVTMNDVVDETTVAASLCDFTFSFSQGNLVDQTIDTCGTITTTSPIPPEPGPSITCQGKPCTSFIAASAAPTTVAVSYTVGEDAPVLDVYGNFLSYLPAQSCYVQTSPTGGSFYNLGTIPPPACTPGDIVVVPDGGVVAAGGGEQVITYTYTTDGETIIVATTLPSHGGPFHLSGGGNRVDGANASLLFWFWAIAGVVSVTGMLVL